MRIFISGVNGFIGTNLINRILSSTDLDIIGIDIEKDRLTEEILRNQRFEFYHGDISISREWVEFQVKRADIVIPLAAVAVPKVYVENPLKIFHLDFMENVKIIEYAVKYKKRLIFPSTSEVYGRCTDEFFDDETSDLVLGPIKYHRWIYSCSKQLIDRLIHAYGLQENFDYTLFRPFNWVGGNLDRISKDSIGRSRVITEFISSITFNKDIILVDGGEQKRCFCYIDDGINALMKIIENPSGNCSQQIINIGNPDNEVSIKRLAQLLVEIYNKHPRAEDSPFTARIKELKSENYYGQGYQDLLTRKPLITRAKKILGWEPVHNLEETIENTLVSFFK